MKKHLFILMTVFTFTRAFALPSVRTGVKEIDDLVILAHEEVSKNIRSDGTFCAGAKWPTAWTRDMSYAIDLSLSFLFPDAVEKSLESRIENDLILQDTGSGGSYPVSTDRITWITAAYDYALYKQSDAYFEKVYRVAKKTLTQDFNVNFYEKNGLFRGESSFLDWREQTYPRWATNEYIAESFALGTNMMYYSALKKTALLAEKTKKPQEEIDLWNKRADSLKKSIIENFWLEEKKYFASLLLKDIDLYTYEGYETLGESLGVILQVAPENFYKYVTGAVKPQDYGLSVVAPQLSNVPSYHNDAVWPFVQGYRALACKKARDAFYAEKEFEAMIFAAKKFGTFKENYVASTFSPDTQTNSDRQLWSDAGFLSYIYKILFGIETEQYGIYFRPFVFSSLQNGIELRNLKIADNNISIRIKGYGDKVVKYVVNGKNVSNDFYIPYEAKEDYDIQLELIPSKEFMDSYDSEKRVIPHFDAGTVTPPVPNARYITEKNTTDITFKPNNKSGFKIVTDGKEITTSNNTVSIKALDKVVLTKAFSLPLEKNPNIPLFPSKTIRAESSKNTFFYEAEKADFIGGKLCKEETESFVNAKLSQDLIKTEANDGVYISDFGKAEGEYIEFNVNIKKDGNYAIDFRFKNGHGPVNTGEKCSILSVLLDENLVRRLAFPQQGSWSSWSFTAPEVVYLNKGKHKIKLSVDEWCHAQHGNLNSVNIDLLRVARIN